MKTFYLINDEGLILDDCLAMSKDSAMYKFIARGHVLPFGVTE